MTVPALTSTVAILLIDDHTLLREAVRQSIDLEPDLHVVDSVSSGSAGVALLPVLRPDVVVLDVEIPGEDVTTTIERIAVAQPTARILIVTMHNDMSLLQRLLGLGVAGYLHKSATRDELICAIRAAHEGVRVTVVAPRIDAGPQSGRGATAPTDDTLTPREREVLVCVAAAMSNRQIAGELGIAEGTVKRHMRNIFDKLGAESRIDAVKRASPSGVIEFHRP